MTDGLPTSLNDFLTLAVGQGASDLHLVAGYRPTLRLHGQLRPLDAAVLSDTDTRDLLLPLCPEKFRGQFDATQNVDFALEATLQGEVRRFRVNLFANSGQLGGCLRIIATSIPEFDWAGFPRALAERLTQFRNGLVLISGVTGAGKTTTLAMLINRMNQAGGYRIITVEEPIEYIFPRNENSLVSQREVGQDVGSFADGLKYGLRQDPDVILVGEIRDRATAQMALSAAETGHLVFSTLHTRDAKGAVSRYVDLFPQTVQSEIRAQLAMSLRAVISQHLLPAWPPGEKRELALEVMFNNAPIASAIRLGKLETIDTNIQTGRADGMLTLDESIKRLWQAGKISQETAERFVSDRRLLTK
jgi:twitching motility protein PilT